jgi:glycosyltransferase involved in cell wall biosynthesis
MSNNANFNKIRILYIIASLEVGGAEGQLYELVKGLNRKIYDPVVCSLLNRGAYIDKILNEGIPVITIANSLKYQPFNIFKIIKAIYCYDIKIVHCIMFTSAIFGTFIAKLLRVPVIINSVRSLRFIGSHYRIPVMRFIYKISDCIIVNSLMTKYLLVSHHIASANKTLVIWNGVDIDKFARAKSLSGHAQSNNTILKMEWTNVAGIIANLFPVKNHYCLLKAIPIILKKFPRTAFLIIGDGPEKENLQRFSAHLKIQENTFFLGQRADIPDLLALMDLTVLCSFREGLPNAILESMAAGLPVIATNVGGNSEAIADGVTGFLFEPHDFLTLANKVIELLADSLLRLQIGSAAKRRAEEQFSRERLIYNYEEVYKSLLMKKAPRLLGDS